MTSKIPTIGNRIINIVRGGVNKGSGGLRILGGAAGRVPGYAEKIMTKARRRLPIPVPSLNHGSGEGIIEGKSPLTIRFARHGCANRPFYYIVLTKRYNHQTLPIIEQLGSYDPMPNINNEKLVALNYERIKYWIGSGADLSDPVRELLGLSGFLPIFPTTYMKAWRNRRAEAEKANKVSEDSQKT